MTPHITGPLAVCATAGLFTLGALLRAGSPGPLPDTPINAPTAAVPTLDIAGFAFGAVVARPGAVVTVTNRDGDAHTVTAADHSFDVRVSGGRKAALRAPARAGTYTFTCSIHPSMRGRLVVS